MWGAVADGPRRQRLPSAQVRAHDQRIEDAGGRPGVRQPLVAPRRHPCQGKGRAAQQPRKPLHLAHVVQSIVAHALGVAHPGGKHLRPRHVLALLRRQTKMACHRFEAVPGQVTRGEVVAPHGVQRVDQLAARRHPAAAALARRRIAGAAFGAVHPPGPIATRGGPLPQSRRAGPAQRQRHREQLGTPGEEGQVESMQIVVLDHVRVTLADERGKPADQVGLGLGALQPAFHDVQRALQSAIVAHGDEKDAVATGMQAGGLQVEL